MEVNFGPALPPRGMDTEPQSNQAYNQSKVFVVLFVQNHFSHSNKYLEISIIYMIVEQSYFLYY